MNWVALFLCDRGKLISFVVFFDLLILSHLFCSVYRFLFSARTKGLMKIRAEVHWVLHEFSVVQ